MALKEDLVKVHKWKGWKVNMCYVDGKLMKLMVSTRQFFRFEFQLWPSPRLSSYQSTMLFHSFSKREACQAEFRHLIQSHS